jgi:hypothetical protein
MARCGDVTVKSVGVRLVPGGLDGQRGKRSNQKQQTSKGSVSGPKPILINMSGSFFSPQDTVFDSHNKLWVVDGGMARGIH